MIETTELLQSYVQGIRALSGARSVSLYVPASLSGLSQPFLIADGDEPHVPELVSLEAAEAFAAAARPDAPKGGVLELLPSAAPNARLLPLPSVESFWSGGVWQDPQPQSEDASRARRRTDGKPPTSQPSAWVGFRFSSDGPALAERLKNRDFLEKLAQDDSVPWWEWLFALGGALASHASQVAAILKDPITGFPDRAGFQAILSEELERSRQSGHPLSLLLINPDEFATINERFGREAGDSIVRDISQRLRSALRSSDPISRYGGVIFAAILCETNLATAREVAGKVLEGLGEESFLGGAVRLGFSIGIGTFERSDTPRMSPLELVRRADQALNAAKRLGGGCMVDWEERSGLEESGAFDRLSGIFTGNLSKDYRNMVLLWDTIDVIAVNPDFEGLSGEVAERLYAAFKPKRIGIFSTREDGSLGLTRGFTRRGTGSRNQSRVETVELTDEDQELLRLAVAAGEPREGERTTENDEEVTYAIPLRTGGAALGALFLSGDEDNLVLESSDLIFLKALGGQLAVALDRARLAQLDQERQEGERRRLKAELKELRQALQQAKLVYRSPEMEEAIATARRVAPTDATVLITGESGTGKELLARTVHELSSRRERPFVIVDCGAIATTLIESELFGHEKGAYTGAQARRRGQLAEADTGTVFLDEIGELPLEVQSKLLRFVQEKQFSLVGGSRTLRVDVRIVAATNRDLALEVAAGRFREDLYYRLNVVRVEVPALRQRPDDVLHLARHFLDMFTVQYQKNVRRFTSAAENDLLRYQWPGNVRELQNRIMQAVILCDGDELEAGDLDLPMESALPSALDAARQLRTTTSAAAASGASGPTLLGEDCWARLRETLGREVDLALTDGREMLFPLGSWLREDLILAADEAARGVARRAAAMIGVAETTFRRRLSKAQREQRSGLSPRSGRWSDVQRLLGDVVRESADGDQASEDLVRKASKVLLEIILERIPDDVTSGAHLLGVTAPTFRTRTAELQSRSSAGS